MKTAAWFIVSELLLVLTIVLIFSNWQGNANVAIAWPLSGSTLAITGAAHGARVLLALCSAVLTVATFILGIIRMFTRSKSGTVVTVRPSTVPPPAPPPSSRV